MLAIWMLPLAPRKSRALALNTAALIASSFMPLVYTSITKNGELSIVIFATLAST